jgi:predicted DNA-binding helix-hairpin-helix protein
LDRELDPKAMWALRHPHYFPLDVQRASYEQLIRVPGLGLRSARRLVSARRFGHLRWEDLPRLGVVMKRARFFLSCTGRTPDRVPAGTELRQHLAKAEKQALTQLEFAW